MLALLLGGGLPGIPATAQEASTLPAPTQGVFDSVMKNDLAAVKRSVEAGADVTLRNTRGLTPAEFAVEIGNIEIANYLLAQERGQLRAQQEAKERQRAAAKSGKTAAKKSEPTRAKTPEKPQETAQDKNRDEAVPIQPRTTVVPPVGGNADGPSPAESRRSRNFFQWLAGLMARDDEPPPAKPGEPKTTAKPEEPKPPAPPEARKEPPPAPATAMKAKAAKGKKAAEPLPPPEQQQRSRNFFEWLADNMAGRESRATRKPGLPEGLREPPVLSERDPWAAVVTPVIPPPAVPAPDAQAAASTPALAPPPAPAEIAEAKPEPAPFAAARPEPVPGETVPGSWTPTIEHGGTTPAPDSRIAAAPQDPAKTEDRELLFSRPGAAPKAASKKSDKKPDESGGGLFGLGEKKDAAQDKGKSAEPDGGLWGSKVEMAQARPMVGAPPAAPPVPERVPVGLGFMVGRSLNLDKADPPRGSDETGGRSCVEKSRGQVLFCVEATNWPKAMEPDFTVNTILYTGQQAVVRYDRSRATRIQTLFPSESFDRVAAYYSGLYGPPAEAWTRSIAPLAVARRDNPTRAWRARNPKTNEIATLEIRKFDDTRGGFPDTKRGVVMLYYHEAAPIFPLVSALELMRLKRPPIGQPEKSGNQ